MRVAGLAHVAFHVTDMKESLRFYVDCLGLQHIFELRNEDGSDWLAYLKVSDRQFIELFYGGKKKRVTIWPDFSDPQALKRLTDNQIQELRYQMATHMSFEVKDIFEAKKRIEEFGFYSPQPVPTLGKDRNYGMFIEDPDGNLIELVQIMPGALQLRTDSVK